MKGILLTGGMGSRLQPLTNVTNKHLLPVYDKPMVYYPIETMVNSGINDILIVCGGNSASEFIRVLENGETFGLKQFHYRYQSQPRGVADALSLAEVWAGNDPIAVFLGDNIFEDTFKDIIKQFEHDPKGAMIFGTEVNHPENYGVIIQDEFENIIEIQEKPENPQSNLIATGLYLYDNTVWGYIKQLSPSARGELEITDVNNHYIKKGVMKCQKIKGEWYDCGENFDGYLDAQNAAKRWKESKNVSSS